MADQDYEDGPVELETAGKSDAQYESEIKQRTSDITKMLNTGKALEALPLALTDPPVNSKSADIKDMNTQIVLQVLNTIKEAQVDGAVNALNDDQLDVLMKYVYRGLANGETSAPFFKWHESVLKKGGLGSIVRAITDRKNV
eukprot:TRINITY_DN595_c0_g1_i1.p1 TRINITY_DN595_c0_g1~~TRINITY_DN595_c0_g1_i1.p1  ORF type:complete len:160 (-),score=49.87 TRINITY_DN595_c0_g1_i1:88-513(-)